MSRLIRKNSISNEDQELKQLKSYILEMEQNPKLYNELTQDQVFGILCIILKKSSYHRSFSEIDILKKATMHIDYFQKLIEKEQGILLWERCLRKMNYVYLSYGQTLFKEGDVGTTFYIILQGRVSIHKTLLVGNEYQDKELIQLMDGQAFGELALENNEPRSASVRAILPTHLAVLDSEDYLVIKKNVHNQQRSMYFEEFSKLSIFKDWKFQSIKGLFDVIKLNKYGLNHIVYKEGDLSQEIFFIQQGEFKVVKSLKMDNQEHNQEDELEYLKSQFVSSKHILSNQERIESLHQKKLYGHLVANDKKQQFTLKFLGSGEMFGELEILKGQDLPRQFSVISTQESNNVYVISKKDFIRVMTSDPLLLNSLKSSNNQKMKWLVSQIKIYQLNFIDQTEKKGTLERIQNQSLLSPKQLEENDLTYQQNNENNSDKFEKEQKQNNQRSKMQISKISSRGKSIESRMRLKMLTLNQEYDDNQLKSEHSTKNDRQKALEQVMKSSYRASAVIDPKKYLKKQSPQNILGINLSSFTIPHKILTQHSSTQRQHMSTTTRLEQTSRFQNGRFYFSQSLPYILQNNYIKLKIKEY